MEKGWVGGGRGETGFGRKRWRCTGRVTDAPFKEGKRREVVGRRGMRRGEVERKIQTCWGKLTDAEMEWMKRGDRWVVRGQGLASFLCIWMRNEAARVRAAGGGEAELVNEHGKAFTKSGLLTPPPTRTL